MRKLIFLFQIYQMMKNSYWNKSKWYFTRDLFFMPEVSFNAGGVNDTQKDAFAQTRKD